MACPQSGFALCSFRFAHPAAGPATARFRGSATYTAVPFSANCRSQEAFRQGLRELGYVEGKNIIIEWRSGEQSRERQRAIAAEFVRLKVDIIVTAGSGDIRAAKEATFTIPIVMVTGGRRPLAAGFVASLARPGGNITGLSTLRPELMGNRLELLKEILPKLSARRRHSEFFRPGLWSSLKRVRCCRRGDGHKASAFGYRARPRLSTRVFRAAAKGRAEAALVRVAGPILGTYRTHVLELAVKHRLPTMYERAEEVQAGGLISYGVSSAEMSRRAATYVDKILKGRLPAELPVEQPTKFQLIVNLKAAKQIGLTIPPNVLARADKVIKSRGASSMVMGAAHWRGNHGKKIL